MPYLVAVAGLSSTLSLTILTLLPSEVAISSSAGAIIRHGPHHSAQKSTTTGPEAFNTSDSKVVSDTLSTAMEDSSFRGSRHGAASGCRTYERPFGPSRQPHGGVRAASSSSIAAAETSIKSGTSVHTSAARTARRG